MFFYLFLFATLIHSTIAVTPPKLRKDMVEGDMAVGKHPHHRALAGVPWQASWRVYRKNNHFVIPFAFDQFYEEGGIIMTNSMTVSERNFVLGVIDDLNSQMQGIKFVSHEDEPHYVTIGKYDSGCWSWVGNTATYSDPPISPQALNLDTGCYTEGVVKHELLHAVGFAHEHSRPDRNDFVTINYNNIATEFRVQFDEVPWGQSNGVIYDYGSVMHYHPKAFAIDTRVNTIVTTDPAYQDVIGQREGVSKADLLQIELIYRCSSGVRDYSNFCSPDCPCRLYEGWCDGDSDCVEDLVCNNASIVPREYYVDNPPRICQVYNSSFPPPSPPTEAPTEERVHMVWIGTGAILTACLIALILVVILK